MNKQDFISLPIAAAMIFAAAILCAYAKFMRPWQIVLSSLLIIIPILLTGLYSSKVNKIHRLQLYNKEGFLFRILSGSTFSTIFWTVFAVMDGALIFGELTAQKLEFNLQALFIYLVSFYACKLIADKLISQTYKDFYKPVIIIIWASMASSILSALVWAYFDPLQLNELDKFKTLASAKSYSDSQIEQANAGCLALFYEFASFKAAIALYFISKAANPIIYYIINFISQFIFFLGIGPFLAVAFIKWNDLKRIWCVPSETVSHPQASAIFWSAFLGVIGISGYTVLVVGSETSLSRIKPVVEDTFQSIIKAADKVVAEVDADGALLQPGTVESYNALVIKIASTQIRFFLEEEIRLTNNIYDSLANNVDKYLDWYYSLAAEYARLGKALMGPDELENYMAEKFEEFLYSAKTETYMEELANLEKKMAETVSLPSYADFIKDKFVKPEPWQFVEEIPAPPVVTYAEMLKKMNITDGMFNTRMATATGTGVAAVIGVKVLSKKIAGKVASKGAFKMGAKIVAKAAVKSAMQTVGGAAGGATAGGILGSVVPGLGTGVGALIGGIVGGAIAWIATDEIFLKTEEIMERETYRKELVNAIDEEKNLQISQLQGFLNQINDHLKKTD